MIVAPAERGGRHDPQFSFKTAAPTPELRREPLARVIIQWHPSVMIMQ
jgi:hypothetical protein